MKLVVVFVCVIFISTQVGADIPVIRQKYKLSPKNCNYTEEEWSTPQLSLVMCAVHCIGSGLCRSFARRGADCRILKTCPENCTEATGNDQSWSIYCRAGKAIDS